MKRPGAGLVLNRKKVACVLCRIGLYDERRNRIRPPSWFLLCLCIICDGDTRAQELAGKYLRTRRWPCCPVGTASLSSA